MNFLHMEQTHTPFGRALLQERYAALQRQVPLIYLLICADFVGLSQVAPEGQRGKVILGLLLLAVVVIRLVHWLRTRTRMLSPEAVCKELQRTLLLSGALSVGFCGWAMYLFETGTDSSRHLILVFVSFTCIGCSYGLSSFPSAARLPLLLMAAPFSIRLMAVYEPGFTEAGFCLGVASFLTLRMLTAQEKSFSTLVLSRSQIVEEKERALSAEARAKEEEIKARQISETDELTSLPNRRAFLRALGNAGRAGAEGTFTIAMVDLDGFKPINDTFGHACGDEVLIHIGKRLIETAGEKCLVARMGGDEFAILSDCSTENQAQQLGAKICACLGEPVSINGHELRLSGSCGLALFGTEDFDAGDVLTSGDAALYVAKQSGRGKWVLFAPEMRQAIIRRSHVEQALRTPGVVEQIELEYQPIYDLQGKRLRSFEALARWANPGLAMLSPAEFIPVAEQMGEIENLTHHLLVLAAAEAAHWPEAVGLSFNMSAVPLCSPGYATRLLTLLDRTNFDCSRLQLEVTETALLADVDIARANLLSLRKKGVSIVLDDFGAGFASVSYLREMDFDGVKLDGSLLRGCGIEESSARLLKGVLDLCASLQLPCVAEHIETQGQLAMLVEMGCRDGQGFFLSPPLCPKNARTLAVRSALAEPDARLSRAA